MPESDSEQAQQPAERVTCIDCGKSYNSVKELNRFFRTGEGARCAKRPSCRARQLGAEFDKRGLKRWGRRTQEQLLAIMDCPPKDWDKDKTWESVNESFDRVAAAIECYSTCYPVCLLYAVQTNEDGEPIKDQYTGEWKHHTQRSLGAILGLHQATVSRAILYLKARHRLDEDDGRLYLAFSPKSLSRSERDACARGISDLEGLNALLPSARKILHQTLAAISTDLDACARLKQIAIDACARQNREAADARARAAKTVLDACNGQASLLSRVIEGEADPPSTPSSSSAVEPMRAHSPLEGDDDDGKTPVEQLHAAGFGKGALAKLPSPRPVLPDPTPLMVAEEFHRALVNLFKKAGKPVPIRSQTAPPFSQLANRAGEFVGWFETEEKARKLDHPGGLSSVLKEFFDTPAKEPIVTLPGMRPMLKSEAIALLERHENSEDAEVQNWAREQLAKLGGRRKSADG